MMKASFQKEISSALKFAWPIVFAQIGYLLFSVVDTFMVGRIDPLAIGGVGAANSLFWPVVISFSGVLFSLDPLVSQSLGAGEKDKLKKFLYQGLSVALVLSAATLMILILISYNFSGLTKNVEILKFSSPYYSIMFWSAPFLLLFYVFQRYWQARGVTRPILLIVLGANLINAAANEILIFGHLGIPPMGIEGAAWATLFSRGFMFLGGACLTYKLWHEKWEWKQMGPDLGIYKKMFSLGTPIGMMILFEYSVFSIATIMSARVGAIETSAHQIGIVTVSFLYMLPMGLSNAASYRVGYYVGKGERAFAKKVGSGIIAFSSILMLSIGIILMANTGVLFKLFTRDPAVIAAGKNILFWISLLLVFDACQATAAGCLRGASRTKLASIINFIGHYGVGLTVAYIFCFELGMGVGGLWIGLSSGLGVIAVVLSVHWLLLKESDLLKET